ncbi:hyaluronidase-3 [Colossoma macropomum]|uniref:hyaluronidase-3 n=1 Tax=Colossoma macropomum TaxID=42526 RepID=UPI0018643236|nr:hyaluronidase-3 [Colossoma macropomum]XP_036435016.1 hyaluronidase-3 [Colossoma macropomum]
MFLGSITLLTFSMFLSSPVAGLGSVGGQGFSVVWNMPTARCERRFGVSLPLQQYGIMHNPGQRFLGENISLFYERRLGLYPYINRQGEQVNGGIPQLGFLEAHLLVSKGQLQVLMRRNFSGLAVLDWEAWRPMWSRNFGHKRVYRRLSKELVWLKYPEMSERKVTSVARMEFEQAAKDFMEETLRLGLRECPKGLWGFYGFPSCYNDHGAKHEGYTGQCKPGTESKNDRLKFLWQYSTALYPSVYVRRVLAGNPNTRLMVRHRILEALRVASQHAPGSPPPPVMPYARVAFIRTLKFLKKTDLDFTIGESAALGAAGVVLWGNLAFAKSKRQCLLLRDYINSVLGKYVDALRRGVSRCSENVCQANGRCVRRDPHSDHLIPQLDTTSEFDPDLRSAFKCVCYEGWSGEHCEKTTTHLSEEQETADRNHQQTPAVTVI